MIQFQVRNYVWDAHSETAGTYHERMKVVDPARTALVLIDVWNSHQWPTLWARMQTATQNAIGPAVQWARGVGVDVVHVPSRAYEGVAPEARWLPDETVYLHPSDRGDTPGQYIYFATSNYFEMTDWLAERYDHLIYAGFALNRCLFWRPGGIAWTWRSDGRVPYSFDLTLIEDGTAALEAADTIDTLASTKGFTRLFGSLFGDLTTAADLTQAQTA